MFSVCELHASSRASRSFRFGFNAVSERFAYLPIYLGFFAAVGAPASHTFKAIPFPAFLVLPSDSVIPSYVSSSFPFAILAL